MSHLRPAVAVVLAAALVGCGGLNLAVPVKTSSDGSVAPSAPRATEPAVQRTSVATSTAVLGPSSAAPAAAPAGPPTDPIATLRRRMRPE